MIADQELRDIIFRAEVHGAVISVEIDKEMKEAEGREVIDRVTVDWAGVGPYPMSPIAAAESLSRALSDRFYDHKRPKFLRKYS